MKNALFLVLMLFSACVTNRKPQLAESSHIKLESCWWNCVELYGKVVIATEGGKRPHLNFSDEASLLHGNGGCNTLSGKYVVHDDLLTLQSIVHTERACINNVINEQEFLFFKALQETERYKIYQKNLLGKKKEMLDLYKDRKLVATFEADSLTE